MTIFNWNAHIWLLVSMFHIQKGWIGSRYLYRDVDCLASARYQIFLFWWWNPKT
jgi:hypothetical protein